MTATRGNQSTVMMTETRGIRETIMPKIGKDGPLMMHDTHASKSKKDLPFMTKDGHAPKLKKNMLFMAEDVQAPKSKKDILFMAGDTHARQTPLYKGKFGEGFTFYEFSYKHAQASTHSEIRLTENTPTESPQAAAEEEEAMVLSDEARKWLTENGLGGLLRIADAPPHKEPEQAAATVDLSEVTEGAVQALTGISEGGLQTIELPSSQILSEYFGEYSLSSKAYRTQGGEDQLFGEVARALMDYGFVNPRPPAIAKYRAAIVIAAYEGLQMDWLYFITEGLKEAIKHLTEGKRPWAGITQWLTVLVPPTTPVKNPKRSRQDTTPKKTTKRRRLLEEHAPGWTQEAEVPQAEDSNRQQREEEASTRQEREEEAPPQPLEEEAPRQHREEGSSRQPHKTQRKPATKTKAGKDKEKLAKKTSKKKTDAEPVTLEPEPVPQEEPAVTPEPATLESEPAPRKEPAVAPTEEAETDEDSSEPLLRMPLRQGKERRTARPIPTTAETQQGAKGPPPVTGADEEPSVPKTAVPEPTAAGIGEQGKEQAPEQEKRPETQSGLRSGSMPAPTDKGSLKAKWLRRLSEQLTGVAAQIEKEEEQRERVARTTAKEMLMLRAQVQELQQELAKAQDGTEPVGTSRKQAEPEMEEALRTGPETEKLIETLKEELQAQEALREKEREHRKLVEDDRRRMEEGLRRSRATQNRLEDEKEKLQKEKDRLRRRAEEEIERLREELRQQKDRDDRLRAQANRRLKQKTEDFDRLCKDYKQATSESKNQAAISDRQIERLKEQLKETRLELSQAKEDISAERTLASAQRKDMEALRQEVRELTKSRNEEKVQSTFEISKWRSSYEKQKAEYIEQAQLMADIIRRTRKEKEAASEQAKAGVDRIRLIMSSWNTRAQASIKESAEKLWREWAQQAAELQTLRADAENRKKTGDKFYKMDEDSIVNIREELSEDFYALAEEHLKEIRGLVERLDDGQLATQLELEGYEKDRVRQEAEERTTPISISESERPAEDAPTDNVPRQELPEEGLPVQEEQAQAEVGENEEKSQEKTESGDEVTQPVETGERDTETETEEAQSGSGPNIEETVPPVQAETEQQDEERQPIQPEVGGDTSKEGSEGKATLETSEQGLFDILEED